MTIVAMELVVAIAASRPEAAAAAMLFAAGMACFRTARRACRRLRRRRSLRRCPLCAADAVRALECEVCAELLEHGRLFVEADVFVAALRDEVVGADDLLALIAADTSARGDQSR
jgi:hypothetical protein